VWLSSKPACAFAKAMNFGTIAADPHIAPAAGVVLARVDKHPCTSARSTFVNLVYLTPRNHSAALFKTSNQIVRTPFEAEHQLTCQPSESVSIRGVAGKLLEPVIQEVNILGSDSTRCAACSKTERRIARSFLASLKTSFADVRFRAESLCSRSESPTLSTPACLPN